MTSLDRYRPQKAASVALTRSMVYDSITTYHLWKSDLERYLKTLFPTADIEVTVRVPRADDQRGWRPSLTPRCTQMQPNSNNFRLSIPRYLTQNERMHILDNLRYGQDELDC
ncbi:hypothetical protein NKR23_g9437 [Pleurostoma richardsiae]|uniref:Uncharacterized protein n=1 Tax=Pleurostoma richardsiae TaxID=41990 RepID=A0AA38VEY5_9PEZI|nr:hypothetical protein NKR23_g9437 [Pleurostoma richardsiae]